jgi:hypothetical protein
MQECQTPLSTGAINQNSLYFDQYVSILLEWTTDEVVRFCAYGNLET